MAEETGKCGTEKAEKRPGQEKLDWTFEGRGKIIRKECRHAGRQGSRFIRGHRPERRWGFLSETGGSHGKR
jgi:hypothetical protein